MSTPLDDALTPSMLFEETEAGDLDSPAAGEHRLFVDENGHLSRMDEDDNVTDLEETPGTVTVRTADPASPVNGQGWFFDDGGTPATVSFRYRKGGVTKEIVLGVLS